MTILGWSHFVHNFTESSFTFKLNTVVVNMHCSVLSENGIKLASEDTWRYYLHEEVQCTKSDLRCQECGKLSQKGSLSADSLKLRAPATFTVIINVQ